MLHARSLFFAALAFCLGGSLCAQSGSIKTTDKNGDQVNGNQYSAVEDVYVSVAALPNDTYYFQVTNSSGTVLLSTDDIADREFTLTDGVISGNTHPTGQNGGSTSIQLAPFAAHPDTYKVWVTPKDKYQSNSGTFGFLNSDSKTDNFSIVQCTITGKVFYDGTGTCDPNQKGLSGWRTEIFRLENGTEVFVAFNFTDGSGVYKFAVPLDASGATQYKVYVRAPVYKLENGNLVLVTGEQDGFIGEDERARWLASDGCSNATSTPVAADAETKAGPNFGNVWFVPVDTTANSQTAVFSKEFWASKDGKDKIAECVSNNVIVWPNILNTLANPFTPRPSAPPSGYVTDFPPDGGTDHPFVAAAKTCLASDSVGAGGTGFLRAKNGKVFVVTGRDLSRQFANFTKWVSTNPDGHLGFTISGEIATALLNIKCGGLADRTVYIRTGATLSLTSFDEVVYKAVCLFLVQEDSKGVNDTGARATGDWATLRDAIQTDLDGVDPYPFPFDLGKTTATDSILHPFIRRPQPCTGVLLKRLVPSLLKQFSQINTTTEPTEDEAYVWEPEEDPEGAVPVPAEPYGTGIG